MTYQDYIRKVNELITRKNKLYDSAVYGNDNSTIYAKIDKIDAELSALVNPNDAPLAEDDLMLLSEGEVGSYEDVERIHTWMKKTY